MSVQFAVSMCLTDLDVLVVGGGLVAERRTRDLLKAHARVTVISPAITNGLAELHEAGALAWHQRRYRIGDLEGFWLVQIATNITDVNDAVAAHAHAAQIFSFKGGDSAGATLWRPAITEFDGSIVAVSGGGDPRRAKALRDRLADLINRDSNQKSAEK